MTRLTKANSNLEIDLTAIKETEKDAKVNLCSKNAIKHLHLIAYCAPYYYNRTSWRRRRRSSLLLRVQYPNTRQVDTLHVHMYYDVPIQFAMLEVMCTKWCLRLLTL